MPVATFFRRLPNTYPLVRETVPPAGMITVFAPVEMTPLVRFSVVGVTELVSVTPALLSTVRLVTVAGKPLPVICAAVPL